MMSGLSPHLAMLVLLAVFFLAHYFFGLWPPFSNEFPKVLASIRWWLVPTCPSESGLTTNK
jgi:hypothetical protein